jgi:NADH:ubiquinone oxidoreductase subunit 5 (subunit L)/multisubunit Na+/H+ antiporter MnhA subunit/multisubunit Na+/H+ antiporter MnhB subunit
LFVVLWTHLPTIQQQGALVVNLPWVPQLGLSFSLYLDGLSLLFSLLVTGIGAVIVIYAGYYFEDLPKLIRFYRLLLLFMGGMLGLVLAGNLLMLFVCWEITSIASFFLISFKADDPQARRGALQALIVTAGGGLALLVGLMLLGTAAGSMELDRVLTSGEVLRQHPFYLPIAALLMIGCFSKSAQWPLHFWLPDAMHAPTPASAYLHSATMVKAGIYLLARLYPALGDTDLWQVALTGIGLTTMLVGAVFALRQRDLKACLAYSTISQLGALVALIGQPHGEGIKAALVGVLAHALYKGTLFLVAGIVEHRQGTRQLDALGGLARHMPGVAIIAGIAGLSMAGLPPLLGFVAKETALETLLHGPLPVLTLAIVVFSAALTVAMALILVWDVFIEQPHEHHHADHHHTSRGMLIAPGMLAVGSLVSGLGLNSLILPILSPIVERNGEPIHLSLFSGFNIPFTLSLVAIVGGVAIFQTRKYWLAWRWPALPRGTDIYQTFIGGLEFSANIVLRSQGGKLRYYLVAILISVILLMATAGLTHVSTGTLKIEFTSSADVLKAVLLALSLLATLASILFRRHLLAALALGIAGYSIGGIFLLEPAPDVALVQFLVETLGTVLVIIMLGKISAKERQDAIQNVWKQSRPGILRDVVIATVVGVGVGLFSLSAVINRPERQTVTTWHIDNALPKVGATDIVAAIVTDFRGMDTVIEITVFGMAALGVLTLLATPEPGKTWQFSAARILRQLRERGLVRPDAVFAADKEAVDPQIQQEIAALQAQRPAPPLSSPLTRRVAALILPFALLIALSHILYSGVATGDGFTAGVVSGLGVALWYIVFGYDEAKQRLRWLHPAPLVGVGVGLAILNAALPLLFNQPFLITTQLEQLHLPADIHLTSTMLFEIGIFLAVLGGTSVILETIAHPQEVETL